MQQNVQVHQVQMQAQPLLQQNHMAAPPGVRYDYAGKAAVVLGTLQMVTGMLCIVFQSAAIALGSLTALISSGIWCGILFIITGAFGIASGSKKTTGFIVTFMVMSIISAAFIIALVTCAGLGVGIEANGRYINRCEEHRLDYRYLSRCRYVKVPGRDAVAMNSLLLILAICELVFAICSSVLGCKVCCCSTPAPQSGSVLQVQYVQSSQPQVLLAAPGQALADQHGRVVVQGSPGFAYPYQPVLIQQHVQQQPLQQNAPMGYTTQAFSSPIGIQQTTIGNTQQPMGVAPPMYQQQATAPQP